MPDHFGPVLVPSNLISNIVTKENLDNMRTR